MEKLSICRKIENYLQEKRGWVFGGLIEDMIRQTEGAKASNASRRLRELTNQGILEVQYVQINGIGQHVAQYRIKRPLEQGALL